MQNKEPKMLSKEWKNMQGLGQVAKSITSNASLFEQQQLAYICTYKYL